jgi:hypothetical protein
MKYVFKRILLCCSSPATPPIKIKKNTHTDFIDMKISKFVVIDTN